MQWLNNLFNVINNTKKKSHQLKHSVIISCRPETGPGGSSNVAEGSWSFISPDFSAYESGIATKRYKVPLQEVQKRWPSKRTTGEVSNKKDGLLNERSGRGSKINIV